MFTLPSRLLILIVLAVSFSSLAESKSINHQSKVSASNWMQHVFAYIAEAFRPVQISLFVPDPRNGEFFHANYILRSIMRNTSTLVINTSRLDAGAPIFKLAVFDYPRRTNFYVVLYPTANLMINASHHDVDEIYGILDLMVEIATTPTRPRCLLIFFGVTDVPGSVLESVLLRAWTRKFLDFTVIVLSRSLTHSTLDYYSIDEETVTYHYYNPFLQKYYSGTYTAETSLFPKKLINLHKYLLKVAATNNPPYLILERNATGYPILSRVGSQFRTLRILSMVMNFTYEFAPSATEFYFIDDGYVDKNSLFYRLLEGEINLSVNHLFIRRTNTNYTRLERSIITMTEEYTALIPSQLNKRIKVPSSFIYYFWMSVFMFSIFYLLVYILRLDRRFWSGMRILEILLSQTIVRQPRHWRDRFIFFSVVFLSLSLTMRGTSEMMEIQFEPYEDEATEDLTEMGNQGFTPVVLEQFHDITLEDEIENNAEFKARLEYHKSAKECSARLHTGEKLVCFMTKYIGESLIQRYLDHRDEPNMKLMKPYLWASYKCILFERGSPFLSRFNEILRRLRDSGLLARFDYDVTVRKDVYIMPDKDEILGKKIIDIEHLMVELVFGYVVATLTFIIELLYYKIVKVEMQFPARDFGIFKGKSNGDCGNGHKLNRAQLMSKDRRRIVNRSNVVNKFCY